MKEYRIKPGQDVKLASIPTLPEKSGDDFKEDIKLKTAKLCLKLADLQNVLFAEHQRRVLVLLQGLDTSGKDGTVRNVFSSINPAGLKVEAFKAPTQPELEHDYLRRVHAKAPGNGEIAIFNRSHYEDVLAVRVQELVPEKIWRRRYRHILEFERMLAEEGTLILKFFLHISKDEQKKRLEQRLEQKAKNWKFDPSDVRDRGLWDKYWRAYEEAIERTSTDDAPWYVIPADKKWWRDYCITETIVSALEELPMEYPKPKVDVSRIKISD
jgi:PPK2 family polyphosphate:nucleotide phosphotransferase